MASDTLGIGDEHVLGDAEIEHASAVVAVFGNDGDVGPRHGAGLTRDHSRTVDLDVAAGQWAQARQDVAERALAVALDAGNADDLAGVHLEIEPIEQHPAITAGHRRILDPQHRLVTGLSGGRPSATRFVDHAERGVLACAARRRVRPSPGRGWRIAAGGRPGIHHFAIAHDGDLVGCRDDLGELVADQGDGLTLDSTTRAQHLEQELGLAGDSTDVGSSNTRISGSRRRHLMISTR